jgi:hypothetical protein
VEPQAARNIEDAMQGLPALRRSSLATALVALLGVVGLLYSTACCFECPNNGGNANGAALAIGLGAAIVIPVGIGWAVSKFAAPVPCRQPEADEKLDAADWRALADCQEGRGDDEGAKSSRAMALQLEQAVGAPILSLPPTPAPAP